MFGCLNLGTKSFEYMASGQCGGKVRIDREDTEVLKVTKANGGKFREELVVKLSCS